MSNTNGTTSTRRSTARSRSVTSSALDDIAGRVKKDNDLDPKTKEANQTRRAKVKKEVAEMSIERVTQAVASAKVRITQTLDQLNDEINAKLEELRTINDSIAIAKQELQELHDNDVVASSTADLIAKHEQRKQDLEAEIAAAREAWGREQLIHEEAVRERNAALDKSRLREADDFNFKLGVERRNKEQALAEQIRVAKLQEQQRQELFNKQLEVREADMAAHENELIELRNKVASFDSDVKSKVDVVIKTLIKDLEKDNKIEVDKLKMDHASQQKLLGLEIENLKRVVTDKDALIVKLQNELNTARENVTTLASAALSAQSGQAALNALQSSMSDKNAAKK